MRPRAKSLIGLAYWPMRGISRLLYGKYREGGSSGLRVGYVPCWREAYNQEQGRPLHCRKPKGHVGDCAFW